MLLLAGSLIAAPPAAAQQTTFPLLCMGGGERRPSTESCNVDSPSHYPQGADIVITPQGVPTGTEVKVSCVQGCPPGDPSASKTYWAIYRTQGSTLVFPRDFIEGIHGGGNAILDRAPRYNSTWVVALNGLPVSRTFHVWLHDAYEDAAFAVRPGAMHTIRATGFDAGAEVSWRWERRDPDTGRYSVFATHSTTAGRTGVFAGRVDIPLRFPPAEAKNILACGSAVFDCYRLSVSGAGKLPETVDVQVRTANITRSQITTPPSTAIPQLQRTMNVSHDIDLYYPGGSLTYGPKFLPDEAPVNVALGAPTLRVAVEKYWQVNDSAIMLHEVPLLYDHQRLVWNAKWTIPKDFPVEGGQRYRLRLVEQRDIHGNTINSDVLAQFTVMEASLVPTIGEFWRELERTELGVLRLRVLYHNGTPFNVTDAPAGNTSPLRGCFVHIPPPVTEGAPPAAPTSCANRNLTWGTYYEGAWNFSVRYPRDYASLGQHRFILSNGSQDRWGNLIYSMTSPIFDVTYAEPIVNFSTVQRGQDTSLLERGNRVFVSATITYHDGTPYNSFLRPNPNSEWARILNGTLQRRGPSPTGGYGPLASEEPFNLVQTDANAGRWSGYLQLTDDDSQTPVGIWTFKYHVEDNLTTPNWVSKEFDRQVVSTLVQVCPTFQPTPRVATGTIQKFRFRLYYSECETGREVPIAAIESQVSLRVYSFNPQTQAHQGSPLSNAIIPTYSAATREWTIEYEVPGEMYAGNFVFVVAGADIYGNQVGDNARSRPFSTFTEVLLRGVVSQPAAEVRRGDTATVVFDARPGDTGVDPGRRPRIQLERFDTSTTECPLGPEEHGCWVRERADVRAADPTLEDHVGIFPIGTDTAVGLYRFSLQGRDGSFRIITGVSANFSVVATQVSRAMLSAPPEVVGKGEPFTFFIEQAPGDQITERVMFLNGRPLSMPPPVIRSEFDRMNVTWGIPYDAPTGNYTIRLTGRDVNGNVIMVLTPPIFATPAELTGRLLAQPPRVVERGADARIIFAVAYPDERFYAAADTPRVYVRGSTGALVGEATVRREGLTFIATWTPKADTPLGEYSMEVSPTATGAAGNLFPPLETDAFRVVPGVFRRSGIDETPIEIQRTGSFLYSVPFEFDDEFVAFDLVYHGPSVSTTIDTTQDLVEVSRTPLAHTLDTATRKYVTRVTTTESSQTGTFTIQMTGEDADGNTIVAQSRRTVIRAVALGVNFEAVPNEAFAEGQTLKMNVTIRYGVGKAMDDTQGRPSVAMVYREPTALSGVPVTPRPEIEFENGRWVVTWQAPPTLLPGEYAITIGGFDTYGNQIVTQRSQPFIIGEGSLPASFLKLVPGPSPLLLALAVAVVALVAGRARLGERR